MPTEDTRVFQDLLDRWAEAIVRNDPGLIAEYALPGWLLAGADGTAIDLDRFCAVVAAGDLSHSAMAFDVRHVRVHDDVAVVFARGTNEGQWQGTPFTADEWVTDTFVRASDGWRCLMTTVAPVAPGAVGP
ncbi:nuclear transport factor 2 family protein [Antribacter gilvus]|uniref:nuclear transport factor 2 family protein n=1 Tax=Antribacter gilvus TaxID=2304675 RepID=UPI000F7AB0F1|nr:nuclear transport factor 2 family protein [Antribacter gilvus]